MVATINWLPHIRSLVPRYGAPALIRGSSSPSLTSGWCAVQAEVAASALGGAGGAGGAVLGVQQQEL